MPSLIPRPPPFFVLWFVYNTQTERKPKNKKWGRPGNEAIICHKRATNVYKNVCYASQGIKTAGIKNR